MIYYFSSPTKHAVSCGAENLLLSFAYDGNRVQEYSDQNLMIDSGAFTLWNSSGGTIDIDEYIKFLNKHKSNFIAINLDVIPKTGASAAHIRKCCEESLENYLYMKDRVKQHVLPVYHYGDERQFLDTYLDHTDYLAVSPANDTHENVKREFLRTVYSRIGTNYKTHLLGYSSVSGLFTFPAYSFDSISWKRTTVKGVQLLTASKLAYFHRLRIYDLLRLQKSLREVWERRGVTLWS